MNGPVANLLGDGTRLHLQHGPIDLIIGADGAREAGFNLAQTRFQTILQELVDELPLLRQPVGPSTSRPSGEAARAMYRAARPFADVFVTPMAAVAGAVADTILAAMRDAPLRRAYVNNGGDIALHLTQGTTFSMAIAGTDGTDLGRIEVSASDKIGGVATSSRHGRSLSLGIADSVTVLAKDAATADVAATLIANAVDVPGHRAITRVPANMVQPDSDLGERPVVTAVGALDDHEVSSALNAGTNCAQAMLNDGKIIGAALFLRADARIIGQNGFHPVPDKWIKEHA